MVTVSELKANVIDEVGDSVPPVLASRIDELWDRYADKEAVHPRLQELYTKRSAVEIVRATLRNQVDFSHDGALSLRLSQRITYLNEFRAEVNTEIVRIERIAAAGRSPLIAPLVHVELETPPTPTSVDQNDRLFQGSVYRQNPGIAPIP